MLLHQGKRLGAFIAIVIGFQVAGVYAASSDALDPPALYLSWQRDPTTTMTVQWHTLDEAPTRLQFRTTNAPNWRAASGTSTTLPKSQRDVHTIELTGLSPRTDYEFRFGEGGRIFKFRTMPRDLTEPVRFISGGDVYHQREWMDLMNKLAANLDPAFVVIGGDLAYSFERANTPENMERWDAYFDSWKKQAVTPDGRLIPMLVTIGNHEVQGFYGQTPAQAAAYYALFAMPGSRGYNVLDFGNYMSLILLDSDHTRPVEGEQTAWLKKTLADRRRVPHVFPVYHVPAYPSFRSYDEGESGKISARIREQWCPLFDKYGVNLAFENHDHTFKRTHPIRAGKIDPRGVVYLGDGAWGVGVRKPDPAPRWYIARADAIRHFYLVTLHREARHVMAVDELGRIIDEVYQRVGK
jgi:acid phosphatase type 7